MLTYEEFKEEYQDISIDKSVFSFIESILLRKVNYLTFNRIDMTSEVEQERFYKLLASVIISLNFEGLIAQNNSNSDSSGNIKSESIGEYKKEYFDSTSKTLSESEKQKRINDLILKAIKETYGNTGLMYRGYYYDEP